MHIEADNEILDWATPNFGDSPDDVNLGLVMQSIRWSGAPHSVLMTLDGLEVGVEYSLQLLFFEQCCTRGFDVLVGGKTIVDEFSPQREQGGPGMTGAGAFISYDFTAGAIQSLTIEQWS